MNASVGVKAKKAEKADQADDVPLHFADAKGWTAWLRKNHASNAGIWLAIAKKSAALPSVTYAEALDAALCYGWIDGQRKGADSIHFLQRFTPRRAKSIWSKINQDKVAALIESGRMRTAGLLEIERAKKDGRWAAAYASQKNITVPDDLQAALEKSAKARDFFKTLSAQNRYAILLRLHMAKKPETRQRRLEQFMAMLERHETLHPVTPARPKTARPVKA